MTYYNAPNSVRSYNLFKGIGTLILAVIVVSLLLANSFSRPAQPEPTEAPTMAATEPPKTVEKPADTVTPIPTEESVKVEPPTLSVPEVGDDGAVSMRGTGAPGSTVELWANGESLGQVTVGNDGNWSFDAVFDPGEYDVSVRALDPDGTLLAASEPTKIIVEAPKVEPPTLALPEVGDDGSVALRGTGTPGSTVELWANGERLGKVIVGDDGTWSLDTVLEPGEYDVSARAVDVDGGVLAESEPTTVLVEAAMAELPAFTSPATGEEITSDMVKLAGTGQPGAEIEILDQGEVIATATVQNDGTWSYTYDVEPGAHELAVRNMGDDASTSAALSIDVVAEATAPPDVAALPPEAAEFAEMDIDCGVEDAPEGIDLGETYIVAPCEFMGLIAARTGVTLEALIAANPDIGDPNLIMPGQVINLPPR